VVDADAGDGSDADAAPDVEADAALTPYTFQVHAQVTAAPRELVWNRAHYQFTLAPAAPWERGEPLAGAVVAVDTPTGRVEHVTDERGVAEVTVYREAPFSLTVAREGHLPVRSYHELTVEDVEAQTAAEGAFRFPVLWPVSSRVRPDTVEVRVEAVDPEAATAWMVFGAPMHFMGGQPRWTIIVKRLLGDEPAWVNVMPAEPQPDGSNRFTELIEIELPDTARDRTAWVDIDREPTVEPLRYLGATLELPDDAESGFLVHGLGPDSTFQLLDPETLMAVGAAENHLKAPTRVTAEVISWGRPFDELLWFIQVFHFDATFDLWERWPATTAYPTRGRELAEGFRLMDTPRILSPSDDDGDLTSTFATQPLEGAELRELIIMDDDRRHELWVVAWYHDREVILPPLPEGYAVDLDWPAPGSLGWFGLRAQANVLVADRDPELPQWHDYQVSTSIRERLVLDW
jgi:hypothetical protein